MGGPHVYSQAKQQPYDSHGEQKPHTAPNGRFNESQAYQARSDIGGPVLGGFEVVINSEPIRHGITFV
jgi:hypothetical protein